MLNQENSRLDRSTEKNKEPAAGRQRRQREGKRGDKEREGKKGDRERSTTVGEVGRRRPQNPKHPASPPWKLIRKPCYGLSNTYKRGTNTNFKAQCWSPFICISRQITMPTQQCQACLVSKQ